MRWSEFLSRFDFRIIYRPGTLNTRPDALSRKPEDMPQDVKDDRLRNRRRPLIQPDRFDTATFGEELRLFELDTTRHVDDLVRDSYATSELLTTIVEVLNSKTARAWPKGVKERLKIPFAECKVTQGRVYYRGRLVIDPEDADLQLQLVYRTHASGPGGHPGRTKTIDLMNRTYWWPGMTVQVRKYVNACQLCYKTKQPRTKPVGFLKPLPLPLAPWRDISVDYITPLPPCERRGQIFQHVVVVVDRLTKMRHFIPTVGLSAEELADRFIDRVYSLHGLPETIVSDRGTQFVSAFWRALSGRLAVALKPSSAYHPQTNGQTERINAELEKYLRSFISWAQDDWVDWLPLAEFAGNNVASETTGASPFFINYGFHPRMGVEPMKPCPPELSESQRVEFFKATEVADRFKAIIEEATAMAKQAQDRYEINANRHRDDAPKYKVEDKVWLNMEHQKTGRPSHKLEPRWEGPFVVTKASSHAVTLELPANMRIFPTFHVSMVRPFTDKGMPGQEHTHGDVRANQGRVVTRTDDERDVVEWKFDSIMDYGKADNGRWQYLVKWHGHHQPSWQPAADLKGCDDAIWAYHDQHPEVPGPPAWVKRRASARATAAPQAKPGRALRAQETGAPARAGGPETRRATRSTRRARDAEDGMNTDLARIDRLKSQSVVEKSVRAIAEALGGVLDRGRIL